MNIIISLLLQTFVYTTEPVQVCSFNGAEHRNASVEHVSSYVRYVYWVYTELYTTLQIYIVYVVQDQTNK